MQAVTNSLFLPALVCWVRNHHILVLLCFGWRNILFLEITVHIHDMKYLRKLYQTRNIPPHLLNKYWVYKNKFLRPRNRDTSEQRGSRRTPIQKGSGKHSYSGVLFISPPHKLLKRVIVQQINKTRGPFHCSSEETNSEVSWTKLHSAQCELCLIARLVHVSCSSYCHALCTPHRSELCNSHMRSQTQYWHESSVSLFQLFFSFAWSSFRY